jgi:hypothetical protein
MTGDRIGPHDLDRARRLVKHLQLAVDELADALQAEASADRASNALAATWGLSYVAEAINGGALSMAVDVARNAGASWSQVGEQLCRPAGSRYEPCARRGVTKQAAAKRFGAKPAEYVEPGPSLLDQLEG